MMRCLGCRSTRIRISRLRLSDLAHLLLFHYPVRCRSCLQRDYVNFIAAWRLRRSHTGGQINGSPAANSSH